MRHLTLAAMLVFAAPAAAQYSDSQQSWRTTPRDDQQLQRRQPSYQNDQPRRGLDNFDGDSWRGDRRNGQPLRDVGPQRRQPHNPAGQSLDRCQPYCY